MFKKSYILHDKVIFKIIYSLGFFFIVLFMAYISFRSYNISFTHDECNTYTIVQSLGEDSPFTSTANNHLLNTWLMGQSMRFSGSNSEFALRFPNLLAFLVYIGAVWLLLKQWRNKMMLYLSGWALLVLNPYLIDFFSAARGYGLAMAFSLLAVYFYLKCRESRNFEAFAKDFFLSLLFSLLAAYSNFILINLNLALLALFLLEFSSNYFRKLTKINIPVAIGLVLTLGLNIYHNKIIYDLLTYLQENKELYFGGQHGFIESTLRILIHRSIYLSYYGEQFWKILYHGLLIVFFVLNVTLILRKHSSKLNRVCALLVIMIAAAILQFHMFGIPYPVERTSLFFIPLIGLTIFFIGVDISDWISIYLGRAYLFIGLFMFIVFAIPIGYHFVRNMNAKYIIEWKFDANTKEVVNLIRNDNKDVSKKSIVTSWIFRPSLEFYISKSNLNFNLIIDNEFKTSGDYLYTYTKDLEKVNEYGNYQVLAEFPDTKTSLIVMNKFSN